MSSEMPPKNITMIVAATLQNGIGLNGGLPWRLPGEMKYFARVTTGSGTDQNVVIMGRKTWDGIPAKYRPLPSRYNLIISRTPSSINLTSCENTQSAPSIPAALALLPPQSASSKIFLIGGSQLYSQSLSPFTPPSLSPSPATETETPAPNPKVTRILLTRILSPFTCDAHVPLLPSPSTPGPWAQASWSELVDFVGYRPLGGEGLGEGEREEKGVRYRFEMWVLRE